LELAITLRLLLTVACCVIGKATLAAEPIMTFRCEGPFGRDASHAKLVSRYGAANVVTEYDGQEDADVTVVFPRDPERKLRIKWKDEKARRNPEHIAVAGRSWSVAGVAMGTSLIELERLNGRPFKLNYFDGDYGGAITDWLGGRFQSPLSGGCVFGAFVWIDDKRIPESVNRAIDEEGAPTGEMISSSTALRAAKPLVTQMGVRFK
jgi:hypothetical protein